MEYICHNFSSISYQIRTFCFLPSRTQKLQLVKSKRVIMLYASDYYRSPKEFSLSMYFFISLSRTNTTLSHPHLCLDLRASSSSAKRSGPNVFTTLRDIDMAVSDFLTSLRAFFQSQKKRYKYLSGSKLKGMSDNRILMSTHGIVVSKTLIYAYIKSLSNCASPCNLDFYVTVSF